MQVTSALRLLLFCFDSQTAWHLFGRHLEIWRGHAIFEYLVFFLILLHCNQRALFKYNLTLKSNIFEIYYC